MMSPPNNNFAGEGSLVDFSSRSNKLAFVNLAFEKQASFVAS